QLEKRASFRRTMKRSIDQTMEAGAKGIKVQLAGRLGGAEMARCEKQIAGSIPLSTLRAKIDYGFAEAMTAQGHVGVQVWVNQGMYEGGINDGDDAEAGQAPKKPKRAYKR
ncbi:MAG TPA: 30S ribosomal protein S3, partial [Pirellulaceae bacterium]